MQDPKTLPESSSPFDQTEQPPSARPKAYAPEPTIKPGDRRFINDGLLPLGFACASLFPPGKLGGSPSQRSKVVHVRLPRSGQSKAPRKPVHIPLHPMSKAAIAVRTKVSKHARNRTMYEGSFMRSGRIEAHVKEAL